MSETAIDPSPTADHALIERVAHVPVDEKKRHAGHARLQGARSRCRVQPFSRASGREDEAPLVAGDDAVPSSRSDAAPMTTKHASLPR